jgi:hypothetical protein
MKDSPLICARGRCNMIRTQNNEEQIIPILRKGDAGACAPDLSRQHRVILRSAYLSKVIRRL